ncbi:hypothetical protein AB0H42_33495 [Nocardia sp. NPDC050799]|uniref:hypothetical protein n=1 Tax=Nocardia sp. NPDC050799 TaxID=3154842 RepID=UPI00340FB409
MLDKETLTSVARRFADGNLFAVADMGGWSALRVDEQATLERMLQGMSADETPRPLGEENGAVLFDWLALPTGDHDALLDELRLTCAVPATQKLGLGVWGRGGVYVTPRWDGWTVICGYPPPMDSESMRALLERHRKAPWIGHPYRWVLPASTGRVTAVM